jgi:hypothetical protein
VTIRSLVWAYMMHTWWVSAAYLRTKLVSEIVWSGIRFTLRNGRVWRMERQDGAGKWYSVPRETTLAQAMQQSAQHAATRLQAARGSS